MGEILPAIVSDWTQAGENLDYEVNSFTIEEDKTSEIISSVMTSDLVLFTAFNLHQCRLFEIIRGKLDLKTPIALYLHGLASVGLWPLYKWKWLSLMQPKDFLIVTSEADKKCLDAIEYKGKHYKIPFSVNRIPSSVTLSSGDRLNLVYIGRISEQKNLHTIFWALSLLDKKERSKFKFDIYGKEDHLGSPNMGKVSSNYLQFLQELSKKLDITDIINFHGHLQREDLYQRLNSHQVFISTSLHSDENFGMAALSSLKIGQRAILSAWGGHMEFAGPFANQLALLPVYKTSIGPVISPIDIVESIRNLESLNSVQVHQFSSLDVQEKIEKVIVNANSEQQVSFNDIPKRLSISYDQFTENLQPELKMSRIFAGYHDLNAHHFLKAYGMIHPIPLHKKEDKIIAPWISYIDNKVIINDPHRGKIELSENDSKDLNNFGIAW